LGRGAGPDDIKSLENAPPEPLSRSTVDPESGSIIWVPNELRFQWVNSHPVSRRTRCAQDIYPTRKYNFIRDPNDREK